MTGQRAAVPGTIGNSRSSPMERICRIDTELTPLVEDVGQMIQKPDDKQ